LSHKYSPNTERAAECQRLVDELRPFYEDELNDWEKTFITDLDERLTKYGEGTYISDNQYDTLSKLYERIIG
jgi:hypothetical protein